MEESGAGQQENKRKRSCHVLSADTAKIINDVRSFLEKEAKAKKVHKLMAPVERTAACFAISTRSVVRVRECLDTGDEYPDIDERARGMEVPDKFIPIIRQVIVDMYTAKEHVTLNTLLAKLQDRLITTCLTTWKWSRATLHRFLTAKMSYSYGHRRSHYDNLKEDAFVAAQRVRHIKRMRDFCDQGRSIFYLDETWVNWNMSPTLVWLEEEGKGGIKVPSGKGKRSIVCHIGGETGFSQGAKLVFRGKKSLKDSDYHTEMNANAFFDWMETKVLPNVQRGSVLVLDRATYHTTLTPESRPARSDFHFMTLARVELLSLCKQNKPRPIYEVSILAQRFKCEVILLPVAHPELNSIKMVWSGLKGFVARNNRDFSLAKIEELTRVYLQSFDQSQRSRDRQNARCKLLDTLEPIGQRPPVKWTQLSMLQFLIRASPALRQAKGHKLAVELPSSNARQEPKSVGQQYGTIDDVNDVVLNKTTERFWLVQKVCYHHRIVAQKLSSVPHQFKNHPLDI